MSVATAAWELPRLMDSLARRGWGPDLDGRANGGLRAVLRALTALLPYESAEGRITAAQVADAAGLSVKWARRCMAELERLELITWHRGWLKEGQPRPGWVRVSKRAIAGLIRRLRGAIDDRRAKRRAETAERLAATLKSRTIPPWRRHNPLSSRWELSSTLPTPKGRTAASASDPIPPSTPPQGDLMPACDVCGKAQDACDLANTKVPADRRHGFIPGRHRGTTLVAPAHELHPTSGKTPRGRVRERVAELTRPAQPTLEV